MTTKTNSDAAPRSNVPELSVSELAFSLKKTLEETYGRVRVRGELGRVTVAASGHMYADLKDADACINAICWKTTMGRLSVKPEEGLEVVCTGRISTYPSRSNYQLIIESMELAGEGALLKMLEDRRKRLAAEGLFAAERKQALPFLPAVIGVVTSPTGAVIRDIIHRIEDRFPRRILLWPVPVQGDGAAEKIAAAINGFDSLPQSGGLRPDVLIVARGGGSLEDLMAFNEEIVVRAAANCHIPLISAVGHETDTTLIDYAADIRAPTPTAAAEMAVPRRDELLAQTQTYTQRLSSFWARQRRERQAALQNLGARLGDPRRILETRMQRLDNLFHRLTTGFERTATTAERRLNASVVRLTSPRALLQMKEHAFHKTADRLGHQFEKRLADRSTRLTRTASRLRAPDALLREKTQALAYRTSPLSALLLRRLEDRDKTLRALGRQLESLSFKNVLKRGYAVVQRPDGSLVTDAAQLRAGEDVQLRFRDNQAVPARITDKKA